MSRTKPAARKQVKRKRDLIDNDADQEHRSKRKPQPQPEVRALQHDFDPSIAKMDPQLLADHFAKCIKRHFKEKTALELEDKCLPTKALLDTSAFDSSHNLQSLPTYLEKFAGGKEELTNEAGVASPHTLIICASGIRAADVARAVRVFRTDDCAIAKLFAKHIKLKDSIEYVKKTKIGFGVGTPARIKDIVDAEALNLRDLRRIVIDGSYLDEKKRTIFDMADLFSPILSLLNNDKIKSRYDDDDEHRVQILVF